MPLALFSLEVKSDIIAVQTVTEPLLIPPIILDQTNNVNVSAFSHTKYDKAVPS